jgi:sigma-B regulation protein RsbU (phosphoserine phosphatase)
VRKRLLEGFDALFDLDHPVRGNRLGDLIERAVEDIEGEDFPDWGSPGPGEKVETRSAGELDFHYLPHLFPGMDPDLRLAHRLQFSMLPREVPPGAPVSIAAVLESYCHLSGDLFGWEMLADGGFLLWIVDVSGHGVRAGLSSAVLKVLIDNLRQRGRVGLLAAELNDIFVGCLREETSNLFVTAFFLALSGDGSARYTSAGHPPVLLRRRDTHVEELPATDVPVGMFPGRRYTVADLRIDPADTLLLYTDGVVETVDAAGEHFGLDRLRALVRSETGPPRALTAALYRRIAAHQDMKTLNDDVTFVAARMDGQ